MRAAHLEAVSPGAGSGRREEPEEGPYELVLELSRADSPEDVHGFQYGDRDYLVRVGDGGVKRASISWGEMMGDLAALTGDRPDAEVARRLGERMRRFLDVLDWGGHEEALGRGRWKGGELRLVVRAAAAELYSLPWELVTLEDSGRHLADVPECTLRYEWPNARAERARPEAAREGRVLFAWSEAGGGVPEDKHLLALLKASHEGGFDFDPRRDVLEKVSLEGLEKRLREARQAKAPVSVLHLLCHGAPLETSGPGHYGLALNGPEARGGARELVDGVALGAVLAPYADTLRMVVLCACHGGDGGRLASHLGSVAQELHRAGIEMVVASRLPLSIEGSALLAETLYEKLLVDSRSLEEALGAVRRRLRLEAKGFDWASLQLYARREGEADLRPVVLRPYRGLLAYGPKDRRFFFGRSRLEAELLERVGQAARGQRPCFQVVAGASGAGKSSVVMAGLVPQLPREEWDHVVVRPGELVSAGQPAAGAGSVALRELQHRLHRVWNPEPLPAGEGATPQELLEEVQRLRQARPERKLLLVVDQLEEVFTQLGREECQALMGAVWALGKAPELGCVVVATVRVDHFERCGEVVLDEQTRLDAVVYAEAHRLFVAQMGPEELAEVMEKPARAVGLELEAGLVERLLGDVGQEQGALPLLAHALDLLWQRREERRLTHRAYEEMEGVAGALTHTVERLYEEWGEEERRQARRLLVRLVAMRDLGNPRAQGRVGVEEVLPRERAERECVEAVLERLVGSRLLVKGGAAAGGPEGRGAWVQLAHDTLLRRWKRLARWVEEDWERERQLREVEEWAEDWEKQRGGVDGGASYLLRGDRLGYARSLQDKHGGELSPRCRRLLEESQAAQQREAEAEKQAMRVLSEARARAQNTVRSLLAEQALKKDPTQALLFLREVDASARDQRWVSTAIDILQQPIARAVLRGHGSSVEQVAFSPDGQQVVTASTDGTARVWSVDGRLLVTLEGHDGSVSSVAFSPDGQRVLTASTDGTARVWGARGGLLAILKHEGKVVWATFSPDGQRLATAAEDGKARVWGIQGGLLAWMEEGSGSKVVLATFSPDGQRVVTAAADGAVRVWSLRSELLATMTGHGGAVCWAGFSPDGQRVLTASDDGTARVWGGLGEPLATMAGHGGGVYWAGFSPDGQRVVTASLDGARVWGGQGELLATMAGHGGAVLRACFSPDGQRVLTASLDGTARVWGGQGELLATMAGHGGAVFQAIFSPDGQRVATASLDGTARVWSARAGLPLVLAEHGHSCARLAVFSPDGQRVLTALADGSAQVWGARGGLLATLAGHSGPLSWAAFSPDGERVVTASMDGTARVWGARGGLLATLAGHSGPLSSAEFSPDGERVVTASDDGTARVWSAQGGLLLTLPVPGGRVITAGLNPEGGVVTASQDGALRVWSMQGELLHTVTVHPPGMFAISVSADGQRIVAAESLSPVALVVSNEGVVTLTGHGNALLWVAFSPDSQRVVTASMDGAARVWSVKGELLLTLAGHHGYVLSAVFSPDGEQVMTASVDGKTRIWPLSPRLLMEHLDAATHVRLSIEERQKWLDETPEEARAGFERNSRH